MVKSTLPAEPVLLALFFLCKKKLLHIYIQHTDSFYFFACLINAFILSGIALQAQCLLCSICRAILCCIVGFFGILLARCRSRFSLEIGLVGMSDSIFLKIYIWILFFSDSKTMGKFPHFLNPLYFEGSNLCIFWPLLLRLVLS